MRGIRVVSASSKSSMSRGFHAGRRADIEDADERLDDDFGPFVLDELASGRGRERYRAPEAAGSIFAPSRGSASDRP
jgi:hypothetical protein